VDVGHAVLEQGDVAVLLGEMGINPWNTGREPLPVLEGNEVVRSERELAGRGGSHHRHLGMPGSPGTLAKGHPLRDDGWAIALAHELSVLEGG